MNASYTHIQTGSTTTCYSDRWNGGTREKRTRARSHPSHEKRWRHMVRWASGLTLHYTGRLSFSVCLSPVQQVMTSSVLTLPSRNKTREPVIMVTHAAPRVLLTGRPIGSHFCMSPCYRPASFFSRTLHTPAQRPRPLRTLTYSWCKIPIIIIIKYKLKNDTFKRKYLYPKYSWIYFLLTYFYFITVGRLMAPSVCVGQNVASLCPIVCKSPDVLIQNQYSKLLSAQRGRSLPSQ